MQVVVVVLIRIGEILDSCIARYRFALSEAQVWNSDNHNPYLGLLCRKARLGIPTSKTQISLSPDMGLLCRKASFGIPTSKTQIRVSPDLGFTCRKPSFGIPTSVTHIRFRQIWVFIVGRPIMEFRQATPIFGFALSEAHVWNSDKQYPNQVSPGWVCSETDAG